VAQALKLEQHIKACDLVLTGEGSYDNQSAGGKVVSYVQQLCIQLDKPLAIICGRCDGDVDQSNVFDLMTFTKHNEARCMNDTTTCLNELVDTIAEKLRELAKNV
jgi:glycerate kinase